jgi:hypothetical protein
VYRGLFEKDKLVFSFMMCCDIMKAGGLISEAEWGFFVRGQGGIERVRIEVKVTWMRVYSCRGQGYLNDGSVTGSRSLG